MEVYMSELLSLVITFNEGFILSVKPKIVLFENATEVEIILSAYCEKDGITSKQEQAFEKLKEILEDGKIFQLMENEIIELYENCYLNSDWRIIYKEKYGADLFEGGLTNKKMSKELSLKRIIIKEDGEAAILMDQEIELDNGLAVVLLPELEIQFQDEWL